MKLYKNAQLGIYVARATIGNESPVYAKFTRSLAKGREGHVYNFVHTDGVRYFMNKEQFNNAWVKLTYSKLPVCKIVSIVGEKKVSECKPARIKSSKSVLRRIKQKLSKLDVPECDISIIQHMVGSLVANREGHIDAHKRTIKNNDESLSKAYAEIRALRKSNRKLKSDKRKLKLLANTAIKFINESPCDPDHDLDQIMAHEAYQKALSQSGDLL